MRSLYFMLVVPNVSGSQLRSYRNSAIAIVLVVTSISFISGQTFSQKPAPRPPVIVQPGAPGQPTRQLPTSTRGTLPQRSAKDVEFLQGMIMHHAQAVEMTDMIESRSADRDIRLIGARIAKSQIDEMEFMKRWLESRGEPVSMPMKDSHPHTAGHSMLMPGMLTPKQMEALKNAKGPEFDRLFLTGMIQHHNGALIMVKELFDTAGSAQDAALYNFATDVDSAQRAEIRSMETLLKEKP